MVSRTVLGSDHSILHPPMLLSPAQYNKPTGSATPEVNDPDPAFVKDIDINDSRNRYLLTRGSTQEQVRMGFVGESRIMGGDACHPL